MESPALQEIHRAQSVIERDALMAFLKEEGIVSYTGQRDVIVNLTDHVNLGLEGYSATFEGYRIYVAQENASVARQLIHRQTMKVRNTTPEERIDENAEMKKFISGSVFSLMLPGIMNVVALYWLIRALQKKQRTTLFRFLFAVVVWSATGYLSMLSLLHFLKPG